VKKGRYSTAGNQVRNVENRSHSVKPEMLEGG
jgi:hypothetical protein